MSSYGDQGSRHREVRPLSTENYSCVKANSGKEALKTLRQDQDFAIILMDVQMPLLDGHKATALLREKGYKKPIIALTAHALKEDHDKCIEAGCNYFMTKPIQRKDLINTINKFKS